LDLITVKVYTRIEMGSGLRRSSRQVGNILGVYKGTGEKRIVTADLLTSIIVLNEGCYKYLVEEVLDEHKLAKRLNIPILSECTGGCTHWKHLLQELQHQGTLRTFSDGSVTSEGATYYRTLVAECEGGLTEICWGGGPVPSALGSPMSSYRAESMGLLSTLLWLAKYVSNSHIIHTLDNQGVLAHWDQMFNMSDSERLTEKDKDIWTWIRVARAEILINNKITLQWTPSHQDRVKQRHQLTLNDQGNIMADAGATLMHSKNLAASDLSGGPEWELYDGDQIVTGSPFHYIKDKILLKNSEKFISHYSARFQGVDLWRGVDWEAGRTIWRGLSADKRVQLIKLTWGIAATSSILAKRSTEEIDGLPLCKLCASGTEETAWHLLSKCKEPSLTQIRKDIGDQLSSFLQELGLSGQERALFRRMWAPADEGHLEDFLGETDQGLIEQTGTTHAWSDILVEQLIKALGYRRWSPFGMVHRAWGKALVALGFSPTKANNIIRKMCKIMVDGSNQLWLIRCKMYHSISKETNGLDASKKLQEILDSEKFLKDPEKRKLIHEFSEKMSTAKKKKLVAKLSEGSNVLHIFKFGVKAGISNATEKMKFWDNSGQGYNFWLSKRTNKGLKRKNKDEHSSAQPKKQGTGQPHTLSSKSNPAHSGQTTTPVSTATQLFPVFRARKRPPPPKVAESETKHGINSAETEQQGQTNGYSTLKTTNKMHPSNKPHDFTANAELDFAKGIG
jgi:hypothetical protein